MAILKYLRVGDTAELQDNGIRWIRIPSHVATSKQSGVIYESEDGTPVYTWWTDAHVMMYKVTEPANEDDGSTVSAASDVELSSIAGLTSAANKIIRYTGSGTAELIDCTAAGAALLDDAAATNQRTTMGVAIGSDVQAYDAGLLNLAGVAMVADRMYYTSADNVHVATPITATGRSIIDDASTAAVLVTIGAAELGANTNITSFTSLTGSIATPVNITMTGAIATPTTITASSHITTAGNIIIDSDSSKLQMGDTPASDSYIYFNGTNMVFYDLANDTAYPSGMTLNQLVAGTTLNPVVNGNLTITQGDFDWTNDTTATESATWTLGAAAVDGIDIVSSNTSANVLHITADATTSGTLLYLQSVDATMTAGEYILCYDGAAQDFAVKRHGEVEIAGIAGSDMLTIALGDVVLSDGSLTITDGDDASALSVTNSTITTNATPIATVVSASLTQGIAFQVNVASMTTGSFIDVLDTSSVFNVKLGGATTIAGIDATTPSLTLTSGDLVITDGFINADMADLAGTGHNFSTAGTATADTNFITVTNSAAAFDVNLLHIDANATGAVDAVNIDYLGAGAYAINIELEAVTGDGILINSVDASTGQSIKLDLGKWVGTAAQGAIHIVSDNFATAEAGHAIYVDLQGTTADAAAISGKGLYISDTGATQAGSYLVHLESLANDAMYVAAGNIVMNTSQSIVLGAGGEHTSYNDGSNSITVLGTDAWLVGSAATNYTSFAVTSGKLSFAGTAQPTQNIWLKAEDFSLLAGTPALGIPAGCKVNAWVMDAAADESISTSFYVPEDWNDGNVTAYIYYNSADAASGAVVFDVITSPFAENEDMAVAGTNTDSVTDTSVSATAYDLNVTGVVNITASTEWAVGDLIVLNVNRDANNGADTNAQDVNFLGIKLVYSANQV